MAAADRKEVKTRVNDIYYKKWVKRWNELQTCRQTKVFYPEIIDYSSYFLKLDRVKLSRIIQFITGHCFLNRHNSLTNSSIDPTCRLCLEEEEEPRHIIFECPALAVERNKYGFRVSNFPFTWSPEGLDGFLSDPNMSSLFDNPGIE